MPKRSEILFSLAAFPVYVWQGLKVRRNTDRMAPPATSGHLSEKGKGQPIEILVVGDSSAAGVGVERIEDSLGGHLVKELSKRTGRPVSVRIAGMNSATSGQIRDHVVPNLERRHYDYICLNIGVNDAKNFHSGRAFCRNFGTLLYALRARFPGARIVWAGIIDMEQIPSLPSPLNRILGIRSRLLDRNGKTLCRERGALAPDPEWRIIRENFSSDGFHASSRGYHEWAENLASYLISLEAEKEASPRDGK
jgi:lysophospholipase L1-like esterase